MKVITGATKILKLKNYSKISLWQLYGSILSLEINILILKSFLQIKIK
jgi:hypothetical protein